MTYADLILKILKEESRWMTFDELYYKAQPDCDWVLFAGILEDLVDKGRVQYTLPCGADTGYYGLLSDRIPYVQ